jgi:outer membrane lipoprotein-sorting protein
MPKSRRTSYLSIAAGVALVLGVAVQGVGRVSAAAQDKASRWDGVKKQMNAASVKFQSAQADFTKEEFERIVQDTSSESGKIYFLRKGGAIQMGAKSPTQTVEYKDGKARLYSPGTGLVKEYAVTGKNQVTAQTILTLGFGGSGDDLNSAWVVDDQGSEQIGDGKQMITVEKLDLVPKDADLKNNYPHVTIWVDPARDVALKQIFFEKSGNTNTATYKNIVVNKTVDTGAFAIKCKGKCS